MRLTMEGKETDCGSYCWPLPQSGQEKRVLNEFVELTGLRVAMRPWCCGIKDGGYCQLKLNIADFTTSCWGLLPSACHKWWPFSRIFT